MTKGFSIALALLLTHPATSQQSCQFQMIAGVSSATGDGGPATAAFLYQPHGMSADASGVLYIADTQNHRVRRVGLDGLISTVAGNGSPGSSGNGGSALAASLNAPEGVAPAPDVSVYIADTGNNQVRRVNPDGTIIVVAGTGQAGFSGDGGPAEVTESGGVVTRYNQAPDRYQGSNAGAPDPPSLGVSLALDPQGNLFISEPNLERIRELPAGSCSLGAQPAISGVLPAPGAPSAGQSVIFAPGELVSIYGTGLGPSSGVLPDPSTTAILPTNFAGVQFSSMASPVRCSTPVPPR
jgi:hypothetical protein